MSYLYWILKYKIKLGTLFKVYVELLPFFSKYSFSDLFLKYLTFIIIYPPCIHSLFQQFKIEL